MCPLSIYELDYEIHDVSPADVSWVSCEAQDKDPTSSSSKYNTRLARLHPYSEIGNTNEMNMRHSNALISREYIAIFKIGRKYLTPCNF